MIRKSLSYKVTPEDERYRIRTILGMRLGVSTRFLRACRNDGDILLNGEHIRTVDSARAGDTLTLVFPKTEPPADVPPEEIPLRVLYEDEDFLAVRKPAGIPVHPSKGHPSGTLLNAIVNKIREDEREGRSDAYEPHLINRLDKDTSGVVLTGKNAYVQDAFAELAKRGAVEKTYRAVVRGIPEPAEGTIDRPIGQPDPLKVGRAVVPEEEGGYPSRTRYRTLKTFRVSDDEKYALLECTLETG
ncbi:MAG: RluA family pseudouridine synthase, partial [Firmicutes bacterium]|nr:RluA family pseudouridine synthase [Bacillota bacterium]